MTTSSATCRRSRTTSPSARCGRSPRQYDESEEFPWAVVRKAAEVGLTCYDLPEEYGGGGVDSLVTTVAIIEELAWGCSRDGRLHRRRRLLRRPDRRARHAGAEAALAAAAVLADRPGIGALATTEPNAGSDAAAMTTTAVEGRRRLRAERPEDVDLVRADGRPVHRVRQTVAGLALAAASRRSCCCAATRASRSARRSRRWAPAATRPPSCSSRTASWPTTAGSARRARASTALMRWFDVTRVQLGANGVGIGRAALEYAVEYAKERAAVRQEDPRVPGRLVPARGRAR